GDVGGRVVNEEALSSGPPYALKQDGVDARVRLDDLHLARQDDGVEPREERKARANPPEGFRRPVAQAEERVTGLLQCAEQRDGRLNRAANRFFPALVVSTDEVCVMRKAFAQFADRDSEGAASILLQVPSDEADFVKEALHRFGV